MKLFRLLRNKKGFTLLELLNVIALLGALAVGLIGALDPFEQLKKGTDTGTRDLVNQVQTAVIRYYSIKNRMPWCADTGVCGADPAVAEILSGPVMNVAIANMRAAGELKDDFETIQAAKLDKIFVYGVAADNKIEVCYEPTAKSFQADPNTKFDPADGLVMGAEGDTCKGHTGDAGVGTEVCYWCIQ